MKRIAFLLATVFLLLVSSCNKDGKDDVLKAIHGPQTLPGSWEFRSYVGGYSSTGSGTAEAGNGNIYTFTENTYTHYSEGVILQSGTYTLTTAPNPNNGEGTPAILFDGLYTVCYSVKNDNLALYMGPIAADGATDTYTRIANAGEAISTSH